MPAGWHPLRIDLGCSDQLRQPPPTSCRPAGGVSGPVTYPDAPPEENPSQTSPTGKEDLKRKDRSSTDESASPEDTIHLSDEEAEARTGSLHCTVSERVQMIESQLLGCGATADETLTAEVAFDDMPFNPMSNDSDEEDDAGDGDFVEYQQAKPNQKSNSPGSSMSSGSWSPTEIKNVFSPLSMSSPPPVTPAAPTSWDHRPSPAGSQASDRHSPTSEWQSNWQPA